MNRMSIAISILLCLAPVPALPHGGGGGGGGEGGDHESKAQTSPDKQALAAAERLNRAGKYAEALPLLNQVLASEPKNADALNELGYANRRLGDQKTALLYYEKALSVDDVHRGANEYLGEL